MSINTSKPIYSELKKYLISTAFFTRENISIENMSTKFKYSLIPVREALIRLAAEDYIDHEAGKGFYTKNYSQKYIYDNHMLMYRIVRWSLDCVTSSTISCENFLSWVNSDESFYKKIEEDHDFYEKAMTFALLCFCEPEHHYLLKNVISKTVLYRKLTHDSRGGVVDAINIIVEIAKNLTSGDKNKALENLTVIEVMELKKINLKYQGVERKFSRPRHPDDV